MALAASTRPATSRPYSSGPLDDTGKLLLRLTLGALMLLHGIGKVTGGIDFILGAVAKAGLPAAFGYLVYVGEVVAPLLLILGAWTRVAALVIVINMVVAVAMVHGAQLAMLTPNGGWGLELQGFYLATALAIALLGAGRYSAGGVEGRWN